MVIENPPPAPEELPQYIVNPLQRQEDKRTLKLIEEYASELRETVEERENEPISEKEIERRIAKNKNVEEIDQTDEGTVVIKTVPCGKDCNGCPHGPYKYTVERVDGKLEWTYHSDW